MALDFAAGCVGGCAGLMVGYPLDTIKVHIQTQDHRNPKFKGTWHCFRTILARESVSGLYRGMTSPMAGVAVINAIVFGVYGQTQRNFADSDHLLTHFLAGASAGLAQAPVCSPLELAKTRLQLQGTEGSRFTGPIHCLRHVYRQEGHRGVFNGLGITALREAPSYGVYFLTYEALTRSSRATEISTVHMLMAGGLAGTASWVATYPVDVIKSRLQADGTGRYAGAIDCFKQSVHAEGHKWLFRGLNSTILRAFPTNAATFTVVTWTFRIFGEDNQQQQQQQVKPEGTKVLEQVPEKKQTVAQPRVQLTRETKARQEPSLLLDKCNLLVARVVNECTYESRSYYSAGIALGGNDDDDEATSIGKSDNDLKQRKVNGGDEETARNKTEEEINSQAEDTERECHRDDDEVG